MSNYTINVGWSGKDALDDDAAGKVISGADFNTEFTTIAEAVNSKADRNGSSSEDFEMDNGTVAGTFAITGVPTAPTQSAGDDTTRIATTEFVTAAVAALDAAAINAIVYPVGSLYFNWKVDTDPNTLLGMGTWERYAEGEVLVGIQDSGTFDALDESLGAETDSHILSTDEIPAHTHNIQRVDSSTGDSTEGFGAYSNYKEAAGTFATASNTTTGSAHSHSTLQPSVTVYIWKRTA